MAKSRLHIFEFKKRNPQAVFLTSENGLYTYEDLERFTAYFKEILLKNDESLSKPVAFISDSSDVLVFSIAACWNLGVPFIPLNPNLNTSDINSFIADVNPSTLFCDNDNFTRFSTYPTLRIEDDFLMNAFSFDLNKVEVTETAEIPDSRLFGYFLTSGTTSKPKIVPLKRSQLYSAASSSALNFKPDPNHYWLLCLPLNHVGGISIILRSLVYKSAIYRMSKFNIEMVMEFLSENLKFQAASLVPTMLKRLLEDPLFKTHKEFKAILLGGGPSNLDLLKKAVERGIPMISSYGMTETCAQIAANPMNAPSGMYTPLKSVGKPFPPNQIEIREEDGRVLGKNQSGFIWIKGPQVFDGYFHKEHNEGKFDKNGWFKTGDYGHINGFGHYFIESRREDLIISGGENINPLEVENAMEEITAIKEVVVIGVPDDEWGQKVTAFITLKNGHTPKIEEIKEFLRTKLLEFKIPKEVHILNELPKTETGKVKRQELLTKFQRLSA